MTATGQESEPNKKEEGKDDKDVQNVPLAALAEVRAAARQAKERAEAAEAELAKLREQISKESKDKPEGFEELSKQVAEINRRESLRNLSVSLGLIDEKQTAAVADLLAQAPSLTPSEALDIAAKRQPDLFKDRGTPGFDPATHMALRPGMETKPKDKKDDFDVRRKAAARMTGIDGSEFVKNLIGHEAAKAMGWENRHKLMPIPKEFST